MLRFRSHKAALLQFQGFRTHINYSNSHLKGSNNILFVTLFYKATKYGYIHYSNETKLMKCIYLCIINPSKNLLFIIL